MMMMMMMMMVMVMMRGMMKRLVSVAAFDLLIG